MAAITVRWCFLTLSGRSCGARIKGLSTVARAAVSAPLLTSELRQHLLQLLAEYHGLQDKANALTQGGRDHKLYQRMSSLEPVVKLVQNLEAKEKEMTELQELLEGSEEGEMKNLAREDLKNCNDTMEWIQKSILGALIPKDSADKNSAILEVRAGAGGKEASLFAAEVFQMYQKFSVYKDWKFEVLETDISDGGGFKHASASLLGTGVFGVMKHESGVHRVQRIPVTEGSGRVHTSTMSVAVLPQPSEIDIQVNPNDLKVETHRSSG